MSDVRERMTMNLRLEPASPEDIELFYSFEQLEDTRGHIFGYSLERHREAITEPSIRYLRIIGAGAESDENTQESIVGFFVLVLEDDDRSVEFRRIVVADKGRGVGQRAIPLMEAYCRSELSLERIWLDVFVDNPRGRHIYEKLGYRRFKEGVIEGRKLFFYEKIF